MLGYFVVLILLEKGNAHVTKEILLSNAVTAKGKGMLDYGISLACRLAADFDLAGLELLLGWLPTMKGWRLLPAGQVKGIHLPWDSEFQIPWGWNHEAGFMDNLKGKAAYLTQARTSTALKVADELGVEYRVIHPGAFAGGEFPAAVLKAIPGLAFENDWTPVGFKGIEAALRCSDLTGAGIVLDTCHLARVAEDADCAIKVAKAVMDRLVAVHVSDYDEKRGEHLVPRWGNEGFKPLPYVLDAVRSARPRVPMVIEVMEGDPRKAVEDTYTYLTR